MKAISGTWQTLTNTFSLIARFPSYSIYPLLSFLVILLTTYVAVIPLVEGVLGRERSTVMEWALVIFTVYCCYALLYGVVTFCNVVLVAGITAQADSDTSLDPFNRALERLKQIAVYILASATVGLVPFFARLLINPLVGGLVAPLIGDKVWVRLQQFTYDIPLQLAVPIIALDQPAPQNLYERGKQLVKDTWGEQMKAQHTIGLLTLVTGLFVTLYAIPMIGQGMDEANADLLWQGLSLGLLAFCIHTQVNALVNAIFALAAYRYATAHKSDLFPGDATYAEAAFVTTQKESKRGNKKSDDGANPALVESPALVAEESSSAIRQRS